MRGLEKVAPVRFKIRGYMPELDGLRGLAILFVLLYHTVKFMALPPDILELGWIGVDLFFVLSGFLITGILLDQKGSPNYFKNFYIRRALRIWPAYYLTLALAYFAGQRLHFSFGTYSASYYALYLQNLVYRDNFPLAFTWSLAVEEHFYLLWPFMVYRFGRRELVKILIATIALTPLIRAVAGIFGVSGSGALYTMTPFRLDGLAMGSLAAVWIRSKSCNKTVWNRTAVLALFISTPVLIHVLLPRSRFVSYTHLALSLFFSGVLGLAISSDGNVFGRALGWKPLRFIGKIAYGLYLYNVASVVLGYKVFARISWTESLDPNLRAVLLVIAELGTTVLFASASWYLFEKPILKLKNRFDYSEPETVPKPTPLVERPELAQIQN
ncbi:MAG: acyltransferase family protein [Acidobacteriaceae bacterium]|nr:acyltransferase family protein [Acidobacteriaceae bacterium]